MTKKECLNCTFAVWASNCLICVNESGEDYKHYVMPDDVCELFERYAGAGDGDEFEKMGAIA